MPKAITRVTTVELLRHADARSREGWVGKPDLERPLTDKGGRQSRALVAKLAGGGGIAALCSSPSWRCVRTLEPLADHLGMTVCVDEGLGEAETLPVHDHGDPWVASAWLAGRTVALLTALVNQHEGGRIVVCTHGDVIPALLAFLVGRDRLALTDVRCQKAGRFTLRFLARRCVGARYHPPVSSDAPGDSPSDDR